MKNTQYPNPPQTNTSQVKFEKPIAAPNRTNSLPNPPLIGAGWAGPSLIKPNLLPSFQTSQNDNQQSNVHAPGYFERTI